MLYIRTEVPHLGQFLLSMFLLNQVSSEVHKAETIEYVYRSPLKYELVHLYFSQISPHNMIVHIVF